MSSDEESPALTFSRSVRKARRAAPDSPSDAENTPPGAYGAHSTQQLLQGGCRPAVGNSELQAPRQLLQATCSSVNNNSSTKQQQLQAAQRQQHKAMWQGSAPSSSSLSSSSNELPVEHAAAAGAGPACSFGDSSSREQPTTADNSSPTTPVAAAAAAGSGSLCCSPAPASAGAEGNSSPATPAAAAVSAGLPASPAAAAAERGSSPVTPAAAAGAGASKKLDVNDPFTPWLRTATKPPRCHAEGKDAAAGDATGGQLFGSPLSVSSSNGTDANVSACNSPSSSSSSPSTKVGPGASLGGSSPQHWQQQQQSGGRGDITDAGLAAATAAPAAAVVADTGDAGPTVITPRSPSSSSGSSSDGDDEEQQLPTFSRRRVFTRGRTQPWQQQQQQRRRQDHRSSRSAAVASSSSSGCEASSTSASSSDFESDAGSADGGSGADHMQAAGDDAAAVTPGCSGHQAAAQPPGSCGACSAGHSGCSRRITPGSSSSLVARRRRRQQQQQQQQQQQVVVDVFDIKTLLTAPRSVRLVIRGVLSPEPDLVAEPRAALSFTPAAKVSSSRQLLGSPVSPLQLALQALAVADNEAATPAAASAGGVTPGAAAGAAPAEAAAKAPNSCFGFSGEAYEALSPAPFRLSWVPGGGGGGGGGGGATPELQHALLHQPPAGFSTTLKPSGTCSRTLELPGRAAAGAGGSSTTGAGRGAAAAGAKTTPPKAPSSRTFARQRQQLSQQLYSQWNDQVFEGGLPGDLPLIWNPRLTSTAGQVVDDGSANHAKASSDERVPVRLELSTKVLDCEARLRTTLAHEMCHVAAWALSREFRQHHGPAFWQWAARFEARVPGISITTCHNYEVHAPFRWQCRNPECGKQYHRHKRSIDTNRHCCSRCNGRLMFMGKFSRDGRLVVPATPAAPGTPGAAAAGGSRGGNVFSAFVKQHFASIKKSLPAGTPHKEVMGRLAAEYKQQKPQASSRAATTAAAAGQPPQLQQQEQQLPPMGRVQQRVEEARVDDRVDADDSGDDEGGQPDNASADDDGLLSFMDRLALVDA